MVSDDGRPGHELYVVRELPENPHPWVQQHVLPVLHKQPVPDHVIQGLVIDYIGAHAGQPIIADWPEDFIHLLKLLLPMPGWAYQLNITMQLVNTVGDLSSEMPHNALSDACALMKWHHSGNGAR
jgi:hypothetical protein